MLADIAQIAQIQTDDIAEDEESERDLFEVGEYVRMVVLMLFQEISLMPVQFSHLMITTMVTQPYTQSIRFINENRATRLPASSATASEAMGADSILVLPSASEKVRNRDCHYPFRQSSDFYYLSGFAEPEAVLVLAQDALKECVLFCRSRDPNMEIGRRAGQKMQLRILVLIRPMPLRNWMNACPCCLIGAKSCFTLPVRIVPLIDDYGVGLIFFMTVNVAAKLPSRIDDRDKIIHRQRRIKSSAESLLCAVLERLALKPTCVRCRSVVRK